MDRRKRSMGFFDEFKETPRDRTRDNICAGLQSLGIDAQMAPRGRAEEEIGPRWPPWWDIFTIRESLRVIDIPEGPARWIYVQKTSLTAVCTGMQRCTKSTIVYPTQANTRLPERRDRNGSDKVPSVSRLGR